MPADAIENTTTYQAEPVYLADEDGRPVLVPVVKATYDIVEDGLRLAEEQVPVNLGGEMWGPPETSSYKFEPESTPLKLATDVALIGHAHAPSAGATEALVALQIGALKKAVRVVGDRVWFKSLGSVSSTPPRPLSAPVPLQWERAFGGWDRTATDPAKHTFEARNPVGVSFRASSRNFQEGLPLPNLEDPLQPLESFGQRVSPVGFGFTGHHWEPRSKLAGTYDEAWTKNRMPLLPKDFDRRFFNAAAPGLVAAGFLRGDEQVAIVNASERGKLVFRLPGVPAPALTVELAEEDVHPALNLDTVILDTDAHRVYLLWRGWVPLRDGPHDVRSIRLSEAKEV